MKYRVLYHYPDGTEEYEDRAFSTREEAEQAGLDGCSAFDQGGEDLELSNPGDYPNDGLGLDFEIIESDGEE